MERDRDSSGQFRSQFARQMATQKEDVETTGDLHQHISHEDTKGGLEQGFRRRLGSGVTALRREVAASSLRRIDSEGRLSSGSSQGGHQEGGQDYFKSKFASSMYGSVGCLSTRGHEVTLGEEQWVSPACFRDILDHKEKVLQGTVREHIGDHRRLSVSGGHAESRGGPGSEISRVETVVSINQGGQQEQNTASPLQIKKLERENKELRRQLSNLERGERSRQLEGGRDGYQELQMQVSMLQTQINQMSSSKELYETSTKQLVTFLEAFTSHLSVSSPSSDNGIRRQSVGSTWRSPNTEHIPRYRRDVNTDLATSYSTLPSRSSLGSYSSTGSILHKLPAGDNLSSNRSSIGSYSTSTLAGMREVGRCDSFTTRLGTKSLRPGEGGVNRRQVLRSKRQQRPYEARTLPKFSDSRPRVMMGSRSVVRRRASLNSGLRGATVSSCDLLEEVSDPADSLEEDIQELVEKGSPVGEELIKTRMGRCKSFASGLSSCTSALGDPGVDSMESKDSGRETETASLTRSSLSSLEQLSQKGNRGKGRGKDESKVQRILRQLKSSWSKSFVKDKNKREHKDDCLFDTSIKDIGSRKDPLKDMDKENVWEDVVEESDSKTVIRIGGTIPRSSSHITLGSDDMKTPAGYSSKRLHSFHHSTPRLLENSSNSSVTVKVPVYYSEILQ